MMEIRVAVADVTGVHALVRRLARVDRSSVAFDGRRKEVRVRSKPALRTVVLVLNAVETSLAEDGVESAKVSLGDRSYTMVSPVARLLDAPAVLSSVEGASTVAGAS